MNDMREETVALVKDRPEFESKLPELLAIDEELEQWEFDDIPLDAGEFGELVSCGLARETDDGYELTDRDAIRAALDGRPSSSSDGTDRSFDRSLVLDIDGPWIATVAVALAFVVLVRVAFVYGSVFRDGNVVLVSNDPYLYRYAVDTLVSSDLSVFFPGDLRGLTIPNLDIYHHDPLLIVGLWFAATALGGTVAASGTALAWYPVIVGTCTAAVVYVITTRVSGDRRAGLVAVLLFAVIPAHAYRTVLGMADHHALDYLWLSATVLGVIYLVTNRTDLRPTAIDYWRRPILWLSVSLVAVGITGQIYSWRAGPLLVLPLAIFAWASVIVQTHHGDAPLTTNAGLCVALAVASLLTAVPFVGLGWGQAFQVVTPVLLLFGVIAMSIAGEIAHRRKWRAPTLAVVSGVVGITLLAVGWVAVPTVSDAFGEFAGYLSSRSGSDIADSASIFQPDRGLFLGPLLEVGVPFYLAVPAAVWGAVVGYRRRRLDWLLLSVYLWFFLLFSLNQIRFLGEMSPFVAVFTAAAFLELADHVDAIEAPTPFEKGATTITNADFHLPSVGTLAPLVALFVLVSGVGVIQTPVKQSQLVIDDDRYRTATWIEEHDQRIGDHLHGDYVFSQWGRNRVFNYVVSGESRGYSYAENNYADFLLAEDAMSWYSWLISNGTGYVVTRDVGMAFPNRSMQTVLHDNWGVPQSDGLGIGHYRAVYASSNSQFRVFALVDGATVRLNHSMEGSVSISRTTPVSVQGGSFAYERPIKLNESGYATFRLPYSGEYSVAGTRFRVNETQVYDGDTVTVDTGG